MTGNRWRKSFLWGLAALLVGPGLGTSGCRSSRKTVASVHATPRMAVKPGPEPFDDERYGIMMGEYPPATAAGEPGGAALPPAEGAEAPGGEWLRFLVDGPAGESRRFDRTPWGDGVELTRGAEYHPALGERARRFKVAADGRRRNGSVVWAGGEWTLAPEVLLPAGGSDRRGGGKETAALPAGMPQAPAAGDPASDPEAAWR